MTVVFRIDRLGSLGVNDMSRRDGTVAETVTVSLVVVPGTTPPATWTPVEVWDLWPIAAAPALTSVPALPGTIASWTCTSQPAPFAGLGFRTVIDAGRPTQAELRRTYKIPNSAGYVPILFAETGDPTARILNAGAAQVAAATDDVAGWRAWATQLNMLLATAGITPAPVVPAFAAYVRVGSAGVSGVQPYTIYLRDGNGVWQPVTWTPTGGSNYYSAWQSGGIAAINGAAWNTGIYVASASANAYAMYGQAVGSPQSPLTPGAALRPYVAAGAGIATVTAQGLTGSAADAGVAVKVYGFVGGVAVVETITLVSGAVQCANTYDANKPIGLVAPAPLQGVVNLRNQALEAGSTVYNSIWPSPIHIQIVRADGKTFEVNVDWAHLNSFTVTGTLAVQARTMGHSPIGSTQFGYGFAGGMIDVQAPSGAAISLPAAVGTSTLGGNNYFFNLAQAVADALGLPALPAAAWRFEGTWGSSWSGAGNRIQHMPGRWNNSEAQIYAAAGGVSVAAAFENSFLAQADGYNGSSYAVQPDWMESDSEGRIGLFSTQPIGAWSFSMRRLDR